MYVELCMEFGKTEINFQQSSNLQGVIMENISTEYAQHHKLKEKMERNLFAGSFHCVKI